MPQLPQLVQHQPTETSTLLLLGRQGCSRTAGSIHIRNSCPKLCLLWKNPRSRPLVDLPPVMPTPIAQPKNIQQSRYGVPKVPLPRPQPSFLQPPLYDRPASNDTNPCRDSSPRRCPQPTTHEIYPVRASPFQASQSPARHTPSPAKGPQPLSTRQRANPFAPTKSTFHRAPGPNFRFHQFTNPLGFNTEHGVHDPKRINNVSTPPHQTLKLTASSCSLRESENEYVKEGSDKDIPQECLHFHINPRFTERFWHWSECFIALADRQNNYLKTMLTRDVALYRVYQKYEPFYLQFDFLHPTQMDVNNQTQKANRAKMLHTIYNYLFVQHHLHRTNPLVHINSRLQYANIKLTSPSYLNNSYIINSKK